MQGLKWNPRYVKYAAANGMSPKRMLRHDRRRYPGGCMCGFLLWSSAKIAKARKERPDWFLNGTLVNHDAYDAWLTATP